MVRLNSGMYTPTYGPTTTGLASTVAVSTTPSVSGSTTVSTNATSANAPVKNDKGVETPKVDVMYTVNAPNTAALSDMDMQEYDKYKKAVDDARAYKDKKWEEWGEAGKAYNEFYQMCRETFNVVSGFPYDSENELHNYVGFKS